MIPPLPDPAIVAEANRVKDARLAEEIKAHHIVEDAKVFDLFIDQLPTLLLEYRSEGRSINIPRSVYDLSAFVEILNDQLSDTAWRFSTGYGSASVIAWSKEEFEPSCQRR